MRRLLLVPVVILVLAGIGLWLDTYIASAANCRYVLGFQTLHDSIPDIVGGCRVNEYYNPSNGDALQQTDNGLLAWRKADNFTAFTDGYRSWVNGPYGIQQRLNTERFPWENDVVETPKAVPLPTSVTKAQALQTPAPPTQIPAPSATPPPPPPPPNPCRVVWEDRVALRPGDFRGYYWNAQPGRNLLIDVQVWGGDRSVWLEFIDPWGTVLRKQPIWDDDKPHDPVVYAAQSYGGSQLNVHNYKPPWYRFSKGTQKTVHILANDCASG